MSRFDELLKKGRIKVDEKCPRTRYRVNADDLRDAKEFLTKQDSERIIMENTDFFQMVGSPTHPDAAPHSIAHCLNGHIRNNPELRKHGIAVGTYNKPDGEVVFTFRHEDWWENEEKNQIPHPEWARKGK